MMNTKIVYVVVSDETDIFLEQALLSVFSLRKYNLDAIVELVVDKDTEKTIYGKRSEIKKHVDHVIAVDVPEVYNKGQKSRWLKTNLRNIVNGDFIYIDTDTIITGSLEEIDEFDGEIGAVKDQHTNIGLNEDRDIIIQWSKQDGWTYYDDLVYFNGGVMYVKDCDFTHAFFREWNKRWQKSCTKYSRLYDQSALAATNEFYHYPIKELGGEWNCQPTNGLSYFFNAIIIHYWRYHRETYAWKFYDKDIIKEIKELGYVSKYISDLIDHAKESFIIPNKIIAGRELDIYYSPVFHVCESHQFIFTLFNIISRLMMRLGRIFR